MEHMNVIMKSGKVKESGLYADERGGFFILDVDTPEELLRLIAPIIDFIAITSHPIVSIDTLQKLFQELMTWIQTPNLLFFTEIFRFYWLASHAFMSITEYLFSEQMGRKYKAKYAVPIGGEFVIKVDSRLRRRIHNHFIDPVS